MQVEWYGQSAFRLSDGQSTVFVDPFGDVSALASRGMQFDYPAIEGVRADLLLITHEHLDHNGVEAIGGSPAILRSTAGQLESPLGQVTAIASEHDDAAGTQRGPNTIFVFEFEGLRVAHFGDFGQAELRDRQREAIGQVDLLFLPVGGGPTIGAEQAARLVEQLAPRFVVPMHYRTPKVSFLETADAFLERMPKVERLDTPMFDTGQLGGDQVAVVPAAP
jgi:L-ascorbate metabolism protein UlaG (beta-lactamase superfamily)